jgi:hypothetical protein
LREPFLVASSLAATSRVLVPGSPSNAAVQIRGLLLVLVPGSVGAIAVQRLSLVAYDIARNVPYSMF